MNEFSDERASDKGARRLIALVAAIVVMAGITSGHASGGWPPPGAFLAVGVLLFFLFGAVRMLDESARKAAPMRVPRD